MPHRRVVLLLPCLVLACGDPADDKGSSSSAGGGNGSISYPIEYQGVATVRRTISIGFDDMSSIECHSTGAWTGTVTAAGVIITGAVDQNATFGGGTTVCDPVTDTISLNGGHNGEHITIDFFFESTPVTFSGSFGTQELLGSYDASWTGVVAGFGEITKTEDVSLALPIKP